MGLSIPSGTVGKGFLIFGAIVAAGLVGVVAYATWAGTQEAARWRSEVASARDQGIIGTLFGKTR